MIMNASNDKINKNNKKNPENISDANANANENNDNINAKEKNKKDIKSKFFNKRNKHKKNKNGNGQDGNDKEKPGQNSQTNQNNIAAPSAASMPPPQKPPAGFNNHSNQHKNKDIRNSQNNQNSQHNQNSQNNPVTQAASKPQPTQPAQSKYANLPKHKLPPLIKAHKKDKDKNEKNKETNTVGSSNTTNSGSTANTVNTVNAVNTVNTANTAKIIKQVNKKPENKTSDKSNNITASDNNVNSFSGSNSSNSGGGGNIGEKVTYFNYKNPRDKDEIPDLYDTEKLFKNPPPVSLPEEDKGEKMEIVGVRFKSVGKIYFFHPDNIKYFAGDKVIVETSRGLEMGYIVIANRHVSIKKIVQPLKHISRRATQEDVKRVERNKNMAKEAVRIANERIKFHNLKMKLIEAEYTFDNSKLLYYFTADGRVDFRELVKDLASIFKIRIELRQIGIRDQTKVLGGLSICGRPFCCNSFLQDFAQVTIKMAKEQNISINSAKISGACGRLMCCLKYEHDTYEYFGKDTPKSGAIVETPENETGVVIESNVLTGMCRVRINQINQKGAGDQGENISDSNVIKPYFKKQLKVIGFMKNDREHKFSGSDGSGMPDIADIADISDDDALLEDADIAIIEDEPSGSGIDIEL